MAIFRGGRRVGPFDLRLGFPRDRSLDNVDGDPRLKQYANTENQMGRFRASMAAANGYARPARFAVRIYPPTNLESIVKSAENTDRRSGGNFEAANSRTPTGPNINALSVALGRQINIHCDSVNMPAHDLQTETITQFGPPREMVTGHGFNGTIAASFYADTFLRERHFIEMWQKMAVNHVTHKAGYYNDYIGKMHIFQLGADSEIGRDMPTYAVEAMEVYPTELGTIEYGYGKKNEVVKINMEFGYKYWRNMSDSTTSRQFAQHMQSPAEVKSANNGLFGMLPPELQRMGRSVLGQARTVFNPTGRITKGRIFGPFF